MLTLSIGMDFSTLTTQRSEKGASLLCFPKKYVVIDIETTGLDPYFDKIIEMSGIRVDSGLISDTFSTLVKPSSEIDPFISELTGITNEMLSSAPSIEDTLADFLNFISDSIVVGHNINFDINFLYDNSVRILGKPFNNDFVDTMRLSRRLLPELQHHRLKDLVSHFEFSQEHVHRALSDCDATNQVLLKLMTFPIELLTKKKGSRAADISTDKQEFDASHPLYGKVCVFTGVLDKMVRREAMQAVADIGGICADSITKATNFLILGNLDYCSIIKDGKSGKQKKAETYLLAGRDIQIISENVFYGMLEDEK